MEATKAQTEIKERPILFSTPMVKAILEGRKTQTRRIVKGNFHPDTAYFETYHHVGELFAAPHDKFRRIMGASVKCPYGKVGDRLWVRETFLDGEDYPCSPHYEDESVSRWLYRADVPQEQWKAVTWKPSIFMPRAASRINLEITNIRVERLNEISNSDAINEGIRPNEGDCNEHETVWKECLCCEEPVTIFKRLWNKINGTGSFENNPYVWVIDFRKL